eukprot:gene7400-7608_t
MNNAGNLSNHGLRSSPPAAFDFESSSQLAIDDAAGTPRLKSAVRSASSRRLADPATGTAARQALSGPGRRKTATLITYSLSGGIGGEGPASVGGLGGLNDSSRRTSNLAQDGPPGIMRPFSHEGSPGSGHAGAVGIGALGGLEGFVGGSEAAAGAPRLFSRQTTLDIGDREQLMDSGMSADRTTIVLSKSASWKVAAARGDGYIETPTLERLKDDLSSLAKMQLQLPASDGDFSRMLLAVSARLSQWPQLEKKAEEQFRGLLEPLLDTVFTSLSPRRGRQQLQRPRRDQQGHRSTADSFDAMIDGDARQPPEPWLKLGAHLIQPELLQGLQYGNRLADDAATSANFTRPAASAAMGHVAAGGFPASEAAS